MKHMVTDNEYSYRQSNIMSEKKKIASEKIWMIWINNESLIDVWEVRWKIVFWKFLNVDSIRKLNR